jgi:phenylacetate-CoA ligase
MRDGVLSRYHRLPPTLRSVVATLRGGYLRAWRYGPETERLVEEAFDREHWSAQRWRAWQEEKLAFVLHRAASRVPHYRAQWSARRRSGDRASWEYLENWPLLEKDALREDPRAFVADDCNRSRMFHDHTSGTSGKSLDLWLDRETVRSWYALFEARCRRWYGVSRHNRWAILGGQLVVPASQTTPPFWVWNAALHQLYMSTYHLAPRFIGAYAEALRQYRVSYAVGYPSSLYAAAREMIAQGISAPRCTVAVMNAEPAFPEQRNAIAEAFQCPVRETYGMAEIVTAASECEHGRMHLWPDVGHVEVLERGGTIEPGPYGELVCTGLLNANMPLVRYRVGDCGSLDPRPGRCACGRTLPRLAGIQGRTNDLLVTRDGRRVFSFGPVFYDMPVREAQIIQETLDRIRVRLSPAPGFTARAASTLVERVRARLGDVSVELEEVSEVPRSANGKFRFIVCNLSSEERERAMAR